MANLMLLGGCDGTGPDGTGGWHHGKSHRPGHARVVRHQRSRRRLVCIDRRGRRSGHDGADRRARLLERDLHLMVGRRLGIVVADMRVVQVVDGVDPKQAPELGLLLRVGMALDASTYDLRPSNGVCDAELAP